MSDETITKAPPQPGVWERIREDVNTIFERDPAARSVWEVVLAYPGFHALLVHRVSNWLWRRGLVTPARFASHLGRFLTGIEIHPGARVGRRFFVDHGMGVVIGETTEIGDDVTIYQEVTLGGTSTHRGKRHPTLEDWVVVGTGAKILGPVTIGRHSRVGAGSVVVSSVPSHSTVVGIPAKVVKTGGKHDPGGQPVIDLDHADLPDPVSRALNSVFEQMERLERRVEELSSGRPGPAAGESAEDVEKIRKIRG
ncbi:MAG: serine O-acetyltransferase [Candidatus Binatia bacterium]